MKVRQYREWIEKEDFYFRRFDLLATRLENYILEYLLIEPLFTKDVASQFDAVIRSCDEIDYQADVTATAYGILHFLPRFRRFQLTFSKLVDKQVLPIGAKDINSLDIGTGPGPSLYALSDVYSSLKKFGEITNTHYLKNINYIPDYVERSVGFRNWLHHLTEVVNNNLPDNEDEWIVPYHHGSFSDFKDIQFNQDFKYVDYDNEGDFFMKTGTLKHRFNIVVSSNFFTQVSQVESLKIELQNCMRYLRNKGKLIISGSSAKSNNKDKDYPEIYKRLKEIILENVYGNYRFYAKAKYVKVSRNKLEFDLQDRFGIRMKQFNQRIHERFIEHDALEHIPEKLRKLFVDSADISYGFKYKWEFHVFDKFSRLKSKKKPA